VQRVSLGWHAIVRYRPGMVVRPGRTGSAGVLFWTVVFACVSALVFGWYAPAFEAEHGVPIVDVDGALEPSRTLALLDAYGEAGRHDYLVFLSLDCVFPVVASLLVIALYRPLLLGLRKGARIRRQVMLVPGLTAVCDLVENTLQALAAIFHPRWSRPLVELACVATVAKFLMIAVTASLLVLLVTLSVRRQIAAK
jgi:hypothetical protein